MNKKYKNSEELINDFNQLINSGGYVFRGIFNREQLNPSICRVHTNNGIKISLENKEFDLLYRLYRNAPYLVKNDFDFLDFVATAQHYGLPTRLIDWTRNPFIATFFAINESDVSEIVYTYLNNNTVINESYSYRDIWQQTNKDCIQKYQKFIYLLTNKRKDLINNINEKTQELLQNGIMENQTKNGGLVFYNAKYSNRRLLAQDGLFSIPIKIKNNKARDEILDNSNTICIEFSQTEKTKMLTYLNSIGINRYRLFQDIDYLCKDIVANMLSGSYDDLKVGIKVEKSIVL